MNKKKVITLFSSILFAGGMLAGCSSDTEETSTDKKEEASVEQVEEQQTSDETAEVSVEDSITSKQIEAYKLMIEELGNAKEGNPVDWDKVGSLYEADLQDAITETNGDFDQAIVTAKDAAAAGELDANIAKQIIDKLTQSYFYQKQKSLHKDVIAFLEEEKQADAELAFAELKLLAQEVIIPTAVKRDSYYELTDTSSMEQSIQAGLAAQEIALNEGNIEDFSVLVQLTDKSIYRSYYLAAQSYAEKIEAAVAEGNADELDLTIMQAEAWGFFQAIKGSLSGGDEAAAQQLDELFSLNMTNPVDIKAEQVHDLFTKAFVGKAKVYHEKVVIALDEGNVNEATIEALEGNMFVKAIELELGDDRIALIEQAEKWYDAVSENKGDEAAPISESIVVTLDKLINE
ncbi:hypothetical protein [Cytobacillus sp. IB215665]|uniref:hypothetical protein n=1 Tax=Cytobacillus sp. IB215665 TaxID=3097357 RepID=UPI002A158141|nr:hypothetical protein [Cytobacillus sp. IB215665]MDX8363999.1 hypothetical protein [Cytobacillus sp. IB215665]